MKINTITHFIKDAFKSLKRNKTISIASIITVLITFFVLGIFVLVANNINKGIDTVQNKVELKIFLNDDIKLIDQREIEIKLREIEGVKDVEYKSKEEEYKNVLKELRKSTSVRRTAKLCDVSVSTVQRIKKEFNL